MNEIQKTGADQVPAHLLQLMQQGTVSTGVESMKHIRILNRVAVIQSNSPKEKKDKFGEGAICVPASDMTLARQGQQIDFVPVLFFEEFIAWNDRKDKSGAMIYDRTTDRESDLAKRCQDPKRWFEYYGPTDVPDDKKLKRSFRHHLNFLAVIYSGPLKGELVVFSFAKSNWRVGAGMISKIRQRKIQGLQAPMWSTVFSCRTVHVTNDGNEWYKFDVNNAEVPWVEASDMEAMKLMHEELTASYKASEFSVGHEAAEGVESTGEADDEM